MALVGGVIIAPRDVGEDKERRDWGWGGLSSCGGPANQSTWLNHDNPAAKVWGLGTVSLRKGKYYVSN